MKKCPYCNAEIDENAHFCLYCMATLQEKEKCEKKQSKTNVWIIAAIAAIIAVILAIMICFALKNKEVDLLVSSSSSFVYFTESNSPSDSSNLEQSETQSEQTGLDPSKPTSSKVESGSKNFVDGDSSKNESTNSNISYESDTAVTNSDSVVSSDESTDGEDTNQDLVDEPSVDSTSSIDPPKTDEGAATYEYRLAQQSDAICEGRYTLPKDAIVITKVTKASIDGVYKIPETIDGKPVVAIMENIFGGEDIRDSVKTVILPSCVKELRGTAFFYCYNLKNIYIEGDYLFLVGGGFFAPSNRRNESLVIYASASCYDATSHVKFKNIAGYNGAEFVEWNG